MPIPMRICTSSEMRQLDQLAESEYRIESRILMENAGRGAVQVLFDHYPGAGKDTEILVFAGKGNNAGDAFVVARRLICLDRKVKIFYLVDPSQYKGATAQNYQILEQMRARMVQLESGEDLNQFFSSSKGPFTIIDGILGTGLKGPIDGIFFEVIESINRQAIPQVVALDIPSGISGDTGAIHATSIMASLTISFGFPKLGHFLPPGAARRGTLVNEDICLPPRFRKEGDKFLLMKNPMNKLLSQRDHYGHKNAFGHTLLIGGSPGKLGAVSMAARACQRMGTGLTTVATWEDGLQALLVKLADEIMAFPLKLKGPDAQQYREFLPRFSSIVVGPGLGTGDDAKELMHQLLLNYNGPLVIDADGLNIVGKHGFHELILKRTGPTVLTPHPGEMARLLGIPKEDVLKDPIAVLKDAVERTHAVVVLKGAATLIGSTEDCLYLNHYPNDGMATAGSGDVLAGMIGGLLGQNMNSFQGTQLGVYLHSLAGALAAEDRGHRSMTAPDIIENIGNAFKDIKTTREPSFPEEGRATLL